MFFLKFVDTWGNMDASLPAKDQSLIVISKVRVCFRPRAVPVVAHRSASPQLHMYLRIEDRSWIGCRAGRNMLDGPHMIPPSCSVDVCHRLHVHTVQ